MGWWYSPSPPMYSTNKTDRHDITEALLKVALNTISLTLILKVKNVSLKIIFQTDQFHGSYVPFETF